VGICVSRKTLFGQASSSSFRFACTIFMSPEVACNRFYFVIVLVPLPFVFFMCSLPAFPPSKTSPSFLPFSGFFGPFYNRIFSQLPFRFGSVIHRPSSNVHAFMLFGRRALLGPNRWPHKSNMSQQFRCQKFYFLFL